MEELKIGTITWYDPKTGAFIEALPEDDAPPVFEKSFSAESQVFIPGDMLKDMGLRTGQLVRYTEKDNIATHVEPLVPTKSRGSRY